MALEDLQLVHLRARDFFVVLLPVNSKTAQSPPPPRKPPEHLTFLKNFVQIPRYVGSLLDGQMPHRLARQNASNSPPTGDFSIIFPCVKPFIQM